MGGASVCRSSCLVPGILWAETMKVLLVNLERFENDLVSFWLFEYLNHARFYLYSLNIWMVCCKSPDWVTDGDSWRAGNSSSIQSEGGNDEIWNEDSGLAGLFLNKSSLDGNPAIGRIIGWGTLVVGTTRPVSCEEHSTNLGPLEIVGYLILFVSILGSAQPGYG